MEMFSGNSVLVVVLLQKGWNILHQVCSSGDLAILEWLLEKEPQLKTKLGQQSEVRVYNSVMRSAIAALSAPPGS